MRKFNVTSLGVMLFVVSFGFQSVGANESAEQKKEEVKSRTVVITQKELAEANELV